MAKIYFVFILFIFAQDQVTSQGYPRAQCQSLGIFQQIVTLCKQKFKTKWISGKKLPQEKKHVQELVNSVQNYLVGKNVDMSLKAQIKSVVLQVTILHQQNHIKTECHLNLRKMEVVAKLLDSQNQPLVTHF